MLGQVGAQQPGRRGRLVRDAVQGGKVGVAIKRAAPGQQFIHHHGQREHVAVVAQVLLLHLLGRHVRGRAHQPCQLRGITAHGQGRAKVGELDFALLGQQHVGGLDVAVHQPFALGVFQRVAAFVGNVQHLRQGQQIICTGKRRQRLPGHVFEHQVWLRGMLIRIQQAHDVGVAQPRGEHHFIAQQLAVAFSLLGLAQQVGVQLLDGHLAAFERIYRPVHHPAGAPAQLGLHLVFANVQGQGRGRVHGRERRGCLSPPAPVQNQPADPARLPGPPTGGSCCRQCPCWRAPRGPLPRKWCGPPE